MNDFQEQQPQADGERPLEEAFAVLRRLEPPLESRIANRRAVAAALGELSIVNPAAKSWWRRSVPVPVPLAAAIGLLMAVLLYSSFRPGREPAKDVVTASSRSVTETKAEPSVAPPAARSKAESLAKWKHYQSEVYLCGVGQLSSEAYYGVEE
jgi:hypothetical protein